MAAVGTLVVVPAPAGLECSVRANSYRPTGGAVKGRRVLANAAQAWRGGDASAIF